MHIYACKWHNNFTEQYSTQQAEVPWWLCWKSARLETWSMHMHAQIPSRAALFVLSPATSEEWDPTLVS